MPEVHLRQSRFACSACGPFTKNKERIQKSKEAGGNLNRKKVTYLLIYKIHRHKIYQFKSHRDKFYQV